MFYRIECKTTLCCWRSTGFQDAHALLRFLPLPKTVSASPSHFASLAAYADSSSGSPGSSMIPAGNQRNVYQVGKVLPVARSASAFLEFSARGTTLERCMMPNIYKRFTTNGSLQGIPVFTLHDSSSSAKGERGSLCMKEWRAGEGVHLRIGLCY